MRLTSQSVLFLCYPPPNSSMAHEALKAFKGQKILYAGELGGDTADSAFELALARCWSLQSTTRLPCFSDTAACLFEFHRLPQPAAGTKRPAAEQKSFSKGVPALVRCSHCQKNGSQTQLRRCRLTRAVYYCSEACRQADVVNYEVQLRIRHMCKPADLLLSNKKLFTKI